MRTPSFKAALRQAIVSYHPRRCRRVQAPSPDRQRCSLLRDLRLEARRQWVAHLRWADLRSVDRRCRTPHHLRWVGPRSVDLRWVDLRWVDLPWVDLPWVDRQWVDRQWVDPRSGDRQWVDLPWVARLRSVTRHHLRRGRWVAMRRLRCSVARLRNHLHRFHLAPSSALIWMRSPRERPLRRRLASNSTCPQRSLLHSHSPSHRSQFSRSSLRLWRPWPQRLRPHRL